MTVNGYDESFKDATLDELLDGEIFYGLVKAEVLIEASWRDDITVRPHSILGYRSPA